MSRTHLFFSIALSLISMSSIASSSFDSKEVKAVLKKIGKGMVYKNGKPVFRKEKACALILSNFETESFDRDILAIAHEGKPSLSNDTGVYPKGTYVGGEFMYEAGVFYDVNTKEERIVQEDGVKFEMCHGKSDTAFATACTSTNFLFKSSIQVTEKGVVLESQSKDWSYKSTCLFWL